MTVDRFREYDAAYVLGALSSDDRRSFEEHLAHCGDCTRAVGELAGLPGLLATVPRAVAVAEPMDPLSSTLPDTSADALPDTLLPALVRRVRQERSRRRWALGLGAAGAALVLTVAGIAVGGGRLDVTTATSSGPSATVPPATPGTLPSLSPSATGSPSGAPMTALVASPVQAHLALTGVAWGTRLELTCTYAEGDGYRATGPAAYVLVVHGRDGRTEQVASWRALPGRTMQLTGASAYAPGDIASVEVHTSNGVPVLELRT